MRASRLQGRRLKLLEAALKVFAHHGYHQAAVADIVEASKIGHGTFYGYFPNKQSIFKALLEEVYQKLATLMTQPCDACQTLEGYQQQLLAVSDRLYELFKVQPELIQVVFYESWAAERDIIQRTESAFAALHNLTEQSLKHAVKQGYLQADLDTRVAASAINAMLFEAMKSAMKSADPDREFAAWKRLVPAMVCRGLSV